MEIILLGKRLEDYPQTDWNEEDLMRRQFNSDFKEHNIKCLLHRLDDDFDHNALDWFIMEGNGFKSTKEIIAMVRVIRSFNILTDEQWKRIIPFVEYGLEANKAYVRMLDEISPIFERYCAEWKNVGMRFTFSKRISLELWQGRFSEHWANPDKKPEYT